MKDLGKTYTRAEINHVTKWCTHDTTAGIIRQLQADLDKLADVLDWYATGQNVWSKQNKAREVLTTYNTRYKEK